MQNYRYQVQNERKSLQRREQTSSIFTQIGNPLTFKVEETEATLQALTACFPWTQTQTQTHFGFPQTQTDGWMFSSKWAKQLDAESVRSACSKHTRSMQACDPGITWTTDECLPQNVLSVCIQFACLVTFLWMRSQRAIQRLWSGFHEPEKSHAHAEMLWHG
jgi:hypothetical protein